MPALQPQLTPAAKKKVVDEAVKRIKARVTLTPTEEKKLRLGLADQADQMLASVASQVVTEELRSVVRSTTANRDQKIASGADALLGLNKDANVVKAFTEQAKLLKKKLDAYAKAGFTPDQAFDLLKIEIRARTERAL